MLKLIIVGRRRAGATRRQALRYLMHVHGRMVIDPPTDAGPMPEDYVQNHVFDGAYPAGADAAHALDRDLVTELWFDSAEALGAATSTNYYLQQLQPDEANFVDRATVSAGLHEETPRRAGATGSFKLFAFLKAQDETATPRLIRALDSVCEGLIGPSAAQDVVRNVPLRRPGAAPFADAILEFWFAEAAGARVFSESLLPGLHGRLGPDLLDPASCLHLLAEEFSTARLRAAHGAARSSSIGADPCRPEMPT